MSAAVSSVPPSANGAADDFKDDYEFHPSLSEEERAFYVKAYPTIDVVREKKTHCTVCKTHIGTAPAQEPYIKMHPILRVTHCTKCHDFYNSGEFSKGEDGSELYCRWCGQGGEVYCCSNCPYVFCKSCIVKNLSRGVVTDIEQNENWSCFSCSTKILWPLRAMHWALTTYIKKQRKHLEGLNLSETEFQQQMAKDTSTCCRLAKAKCGNMSDSMESLDSVTSRRSHGSGTTRKVQKISPAPGPSPKRPKTSNDEVVCTPDLLSMLEPDCEITVTPKARTAPVPVASSPKIMSLQPGYMGQSTSSASKNVTTPPPLVLRNTGLQMRAVAPQPVVRRTIVGARPPAPLGGTSPVYHNINGFRIDLNIAAQQETFRLPNGKLIQVKRQGNQTVASASTGNNSWQPRTSTPTQQRVAAPMQQPPQPGNRPIQITQIHAPQIYQTMNQQQQQQQQTVVHQTQQHVPQSHPQILRYHNTMASAANTVHHRPQTVGQNGNHVQVVNGVPTAPVQGAVAGQVRPQIVRHVFPDTAIGHARSQLQDEVFNCMEISQHLIGKVHSLTNSNAYKQARNYLEVKELYIHLSYLLTYAIGRYKGLQDKCLADMRQLGFVTDADSLENGQLAADKQASDDEDNEIEIVEPKTDTINLDSDEEDAPAPKLPTPQKTRPTAPPIIIQSKNGPPMTVLPMAPPPRVASSMVITPITAGQPIASPPVATPPMVAPRVTAPPMVAQAMAGPPMTVIPTYPQQAASNFVTTTVDSSMECMDDPSFLLASLLDVEFTEGDHPIASSSPPDAVRKQPRKKTTNKPNPTLIKQKQLLMNERLEEMKRNDIKLKKTCKVVLSKVEDLYPWAKNLMEMHKDQAYDSAVTCEPDCVMLSDDDGDDPTKTAKEEMAVVEETNQTSPPSNRAISIEESPTKSNSLNESDNMVVMIDVDDDYEANKSKSPEKNAITVENSPLKVLTVSKISAFSEEATSQELPTLSKNTTPPKGTRPPEVSTQTQSINHSKPIAPPTTSIKSGILIKSATGEAIVPDKTHNVIAMNKDNNDGTDGSSEKDKKQLSVPSTDNVVNVDKDTPSTAVTDEVVVLKEKIPTQTEQIIANTTEISDHVDEAKAVDKDVSSTIGTVTQILDKSNIVGPDKDEGESEIDQTDDSKTVLEITSVPEKKATEEQVDNDYQDKAQHISTTTVIKDVEMDEATNVEISKISDKSAVSKLETLKTTNENSATTVASVEMMSDKAADIIHDMDDNISAEKISTKNEDNAITLQKEPTKNKDNKFAPEEEQIKDDEVAVEELSNDRDNDETAEKVSSAEVNTFPTILADKNEEQEELKLKDLGPSVDKGEVNEIEMLVEAELEQSISVEEQQDEVIKANELGKRIVPQTADIENVMEVEELAETEELQSLDVSSTGVADQLAVDVAIDEMEEDMAMLDGKVNDPTNIIEIENESLLINETAEMDVDENFEPVDHAVSKENILISANEEAAELAAAKPSCSMDSN